MYLDSACTVLQSADEARGRACDGLSRIAGDVTSRGSTRIAADRGTPASAPICGRRAVVPARCAGVDGNLGQAQAAERGGPVCACPGFPSTTRRLAAGVHDRWRSAHIRVSCSSSRKLARHGAARGDAASASLTGRVECWRRGCRSQVGDRHILSGTPQSCRPYPVSSKRSSNRACRFPAHGSRTGFTPRHATAEHDVQRHSGRDRRRRRSAPL
jgi:hypothetical protein